MEQSEETGQDGPVQKKWAQAACSGQYGRISEYEEGLENELLQSSCQ
jgi:hypothetical protein